MRLLAIAFSTAVLALASTADAQPAKPAAPEDAVCLLDMVALSNASTPDAQQIGRDGVAFFAGRISAHDPSFDFARLKTMGQSLNEQTLRTELQQHCGPILQQYMGKVETALSPPAPAATPTPGAK